MGERAHRSPILVRPCTDSTVVPACVAGRPRRSGSVSSVPSMLRAVVKLLILLVDRSSVPAAEQTAHLLSGPRRRRWTRRFCPSVLTRAFGDESEPCSASPSIRLASGGRGSLRPSRSHAKLRSCGTLSVPVTRCGPCTDRTRSARGRGTRAVTRASAPRRPGRCRPSPIATAQSRASAPARRCRLCAPVCRCQNGGDTNG